MAPVIAHSHSSISCFNTCPRQYEAKYVTKEVTFVQSAEAKWGDDVHNALEKYCRDKVTIPIHMAAYTKYADALLSRPGNKVFEGAVALDSNAQPCGYFAKDAQRQNIVWLRGKIDVVNLRPDRALAEVFDWKTGKIKNDPDQLVMYAMMVMLLHPEVETVRAGFAWIKEPLNKAFTPPTTFERKQLPSIIHMHREKTGAIEHAIETGNLPPRPSGLCRGWCDVKSCKFCEAK